MYNIPIFVSSDNNYAPFVATTITSICYNTKEFCTFFVLDGGISDENKERILDLKNHYSNLEIEFLTIDANKIFEGVLVKNNLSLSAFNRLLIPELKPELDRVLYLDVDIIALGDIKELWEENLGDYIIGAIPDNSATFEYYDRAKRILEMDPKSLYFNSGVMIIDCKKWREKVKFQDLMEIEKKYRDVRLYNDQDVLNKYFDNNYKQLDVRYNVMTTQEDCVIKHLTDRAKPWFFSPGTESDVIYNINEFWYYAKMTKFYDLLLANVKPEFEQKVLLIKSKFKNIKKFNFGVTDNDKINEIQTIRHNEVKKLISLLQERAEGDSHSKQYFEALEDSIGMSFALIFSANDSNMKKEIVDEILSLYHINPESHDRLKSKLKISELSYLLEDMDEKNAEKILQEINPYKTIEEYYKAKMLQEMRKNILKNRIPQKMK